MAMLNRINGYLSFKTRITLFDTTLTNGGGLTGLTNASSGLIISTIADTEATATAYTQAGSTIDTIAALGTWVAPTTGHCRFKEVDATNHPGTYELQLSNSRLAVANASELIVAFPTVTGLHLAQQQFKIDLDSQVDAQAIDGDQTAASNLRLSGDQIIQGTISSANFAPTSTQFESSNITTATSGFWNGRSVYATSGALNGQCLGVITAYSLVSGLGHFTVSGSPSGNAPANATTFIIA
jgi:hypothetical protein